MPTLEIKVDKKYNNLFFVKSNCIKIIKLNEFSSEDNT